MKIQKRLVFMYLPRSEDKTLSVLYDLFRKRVFSKSKSNQMKKMDIHLVHLPNGIVKQGLVRTNSFKPIMVDGKETGFNAIVHFLDEEKASFLTVLKNGKANLKNNDAVEKRRNRLLKNSIKKLKKIKKKIKKKNKNKNK